MCNCCASHEDYECCGGGDSCSCHAGKSGCECHPFQRRYQTKAEQITELEGYLSELRNEVQAAEERLADLSK
jgi:hypothetical protein